MSMQVPGWLFLAAMCVPLASVRGQATRAPAQPVHSAGATLTGRVTQAGDSVGVPGAEVELAGTAMRHWTDNRGRFAFPGVAAGSFDVRVRAIGYQPWTERIDFADGVAVDRTVALLRLPNALTQVRIEGRMLKVPARYEDVYRRAARGWGTFITREEIERLNPTDVKSLFYAIPGVMVNDRGITFQRCMDNISGMSVQQVAGMLKGRGGGAGAAKTQVYVDGVRMTRPGADINEALRLVPPAAIQAIEVYRGVAQLPAEFLDDACAVIAIWTKSY